MQPFQAWPVKHWAWESAGTLQAFYAIQLCQQLVDHTVCDTCGVVASLGSDGVKLLKEQHAGRSC